MACPKEDKLLSFSIRTCEDKLATNPRQDIEKGQRLLRKTTEFKDDYAKKLQNQLYPYNRIDQNCKNDEED